MAINYQSNVVPPGMVQGVYNAPASVPALNDGQSAIARLDPSAKLVVALDSYKRATYRAGAVNQTFYSTAAAVLLEIVGSASKTVLIKRIMLWGQCATKYYAELTLLRCTAASAGSATAANKGQHDVNDPAATAVVNYYSAAAAAGTGNAIIGAGVMTVAPPAATLLAYPYEWDFCQHMDRPLILRGTGDVIEVYNNTSGLGAGTFGFEVEWEEE